MYVWINCDFETQESSFNDTTIISLIQRDNLFDSKMVSSVLMQIKIEITKFSLLSAQ